MKKMVLSLVLVLCLALTLFPFGAAAANSAEPLLVHDGDTLSSDTGWFHIRTDADGCYSMRAELLIGRSFVVHPTKDVSALNDMQIDYLHAQLAAEVYGKQLARAEREVESTEQTLQEAKETYAIRIASFEKEREVFEPIRTNRAEIDALVQEADARQQSSVAPVGYVSVESWYRLSVLPRLQRLGYDAPEDPSAVKSNWDWLLVELQQLEEAEEILASTKAQMDEAERLLPIAKEEIATYRELTGAAEEAAAAARSKLTGDVPSTEDFELINTDAAVFGMHENEIYWVCCGEQPGGVTATFREWNFALDEELSHSALSKTLREADGSYVIVERSDGSQASYYCGMLVRVETPEDGKLAIPEMVQDASVTEIGAELVSGDQKITSVTIPATVTRVQTNAFHGCDQLRDVYYAGTQSQWDAIHISSGNEPLKAAVLHVSAEPEPTTSPEPTTMPEAPFRDMPQPGHWAYPGIVFCAENGIMNGMGENLFVPDGETTRAQIVTILWRLAGAPREENPAFREMQLRLFGDVDRNSWYADAVYWAMKTGVTKGTSLTTFEPNTPVTREQLIVFLHRFTWSVKSIAVPESAELSRFPDAARVSGWAAAAMRWAVARDVIHGTKIGSTDYLDPQGHATRAQIATLIRNYCMNVLPEK